MKRARKPKCDKCGHIRERHLGGVGSCQAQRSCGPAGVHRCYCFAYTNCTEERAAPASDKLAIGKPETPKE